MDYVFNLNPEFDDIEDHQEKDDNIDDEIFSKIK